MHITAATDGALRILIALGGGPMTMNRMVGELGLARPLVVKICNRLMQAGYLKGARGRGGGYRLARPAASIDAMSIVDLFEPRQDLFPCNLHQDGECRIVAICKLREVCQSAHHAFRAELERLTIDTLAPARAT